MKLANISYQGDEYVVVSINDTHVIDINRLLSGTSSQYKGSKLADVLDVINGGELLLEAIRTQFGKLNIDVSETIPIIDVKWYPPIRRPGKICGVAMNNSASNERKISAPDHPAFFLKPASCLVGHEQAIKIQDYYGSTHPEPELAVIIGRTSKGVSTDEAMDLVFGYSIFDDVTSNGMRAEDMFHYYALYPSRDNPEELERVEQHVSYTGRYKGSDTFGPMGPWLVTKDEIADPHDLEVNCSVAGQVVAEDSTRYFNYSIPEVISYINRFHTLEPGDVISLGTAFKPSKDNKRSIHHSNLAVTGGPVEISITGLGTLVNPIEYYQEGIRENG